MKSREDKVAGYAPVVIIERESIKIFYLYAIS